MSDQVDAIQASGPALDGHELIPPRWYSVSARGAATLCVNEADALRVASEAYTYSLKQGPHRAVCLAPADALLVMQKRLLSLLERVRPGSEAAAWVVAELERIAAVDAGLPVTGNEERMAPAAGEQHPDDQAVERFAAAMKAKLALARSKGRDGWNDPARCSTESLAQLAVQLVAKGDPLDVANVCMMLHQRGAHPRMLAGASARVQVWVDLEDGDQVISGDRYLDSGTHWRLVHEDCELVGMKFDRLRHYRVQRPAARVRPLLEHSL